MSVPAVSSLVCLLMSLFSLELFSEFSISESLLLSIKLFSELGSFCSSITGSSMICSDNESKSTSKVSCSSSLEMFSKVSNTGSSSATL